ncbi:hypothetical protein [Serratia fonticola]|uniref:hypothetical protein n=1 Tax=Serratia fonticola TaxID=47917 RepID=UPI0027E93C84|nr:hypothetical protein [Serratia fonticola]MDQ7208999.1 hypothetical protein [Serratia fonticola]HBE9079076.1 hypothetical protein [Serratia fonticola]HBE9089565.1 hypothetical protein [Serratia fonticola]
METQYSILGNLVTCTVYDMSGMAYYASVDAEGGKFQVAIDKARELAEKSKDEYREGDLQ